MHTPAVLVHVSFSKSKICEPDMSITVQQYVLRLQITVSGASAVQIRQRSDNLSSIQPSHIFIKHSLQQSPPDRTRRHPIRHTSYTTFLLRCATKQPKHKIGAAHKTNPNSDKDSEGPWQQDSMHACPCMLKAAVYAHTCQHIAVYNATRRTHQPDIASVHHKIETSAAITTMQTQGTST